MAELERQTFAVNPEDIDPTTRQSVYRLASATHTLLEAYGFPLDLRLHTYGNHGSLIIAQDVLPQFNATRTPQDTTYQIEATLPSYTKPHIVNKVRYSFEPPSRPNLTGDLALHGVARMLFQRRGQSNTGAKRLLTPSGPIRAIADVIDDLALGIPGWSFLTA